MEYKMKFEKLGDWCKWLERNFSPEVMIPTLPVIIRFDGNNFHNWAKGLQRPFDDNFRNLMIETTKYLVHETNAVVGYTQSDEITLILYTPNKEVLIYNDGKKQKIISKLSGDIVNFFNSKRLEILPNHNKIAKFDCRIYQTPTLGDAVNQLLWRENDATKNSIQALAQSLFSHKSLQNLNENQLQEKMFQEKGVNWNNLPSSVKRGTYVKRSIKNIPFSKEELSKLPPKHNAHKNPNLIIERSVIDVVEYPPFSSIKNRVQVIFNNEEPLTSY